MEEPVRISSTRGLSGSATILAGKATVSSTNTPRVPTPRGTCGHLLNPMDLLTLLPAEKLSISSTLFLGTIHKSTTKLLWRISFYFFVWNQERFVKLTLKAPVADLTLTSQQHHKFNCSSPTSAPAAHPTPRNRMGFSAAFPTMVGAFSKFSVSATMSVCWGNKRSM